MPQVAVSFAWNYNSTLGRGGRPGDGPMFECKLDNLSHDTVAKLPTMRVSLGIVIEGAEGSSHVF